jgi:hypothetical protein
MLRRSFRLAGLTLLFGALLTPAAHADTRFDIRIGVPGRVVVAPYPYAPPAYAGMIWQPGYYVWAGYGRRWVPGRWIRPAYGYRGPAWRYERRGYDWRYRDERRERDGWRGREWRR